MKTVAIITPSLGLGGAEQWVRTLVTHCSGFRWVVAVLNNDPRHDLVANAVLEHAAEVYAPEGTHSQARSCGSMTANIAAAISQADAVVVWGGGFYWPLPTKVPVVFVGHGSCQWTVATARQALDGGAKHFVGVSDAVAQSMRAAMPNVEVSTIMNGVDASRLTPPSDIRLVRGAWQGNPYDYAKHVGYIGRLGNEKNVDEVVYAITSLPYHYQLVLVGCTGWRADAILAMSRTLLRDRLIEVKATDNLGEVLHSLDCVVQVSPREGHSLAICEAMLCRVPIVSTVTGAIPQLERMAGGDLVERVPEDPLAHEVAAAIRRVCLHPPVDRIAAAERFAREHLTAEVMCRKWTEYLNGVIQ